MPDRIEREIEDILNKLDDFVPEKGQKPIPFKPRRKPANKSKGWAGQSLARLSLNKIMLYALIVAVVAFALRSMPFANWVMLAAFITLVTAFVLSIRAGGGGGSSASGRMLEKRWRGEPLELNPYTHQGPSFGDRIKGWFKGRK